MASNTDTMTAPEYTGDAATKVFAIPELLEEILLLAVVAADQCDTDPWREDSWNLKMWPMPACGNLGEGGVCLYRIQRVSTAFRHTIQGSTKLKKLMFLAREDNSELSKDEDTYLPLHRPVESLMSIMRLCDPDDKMELDEVKVVDGIATASWRVFQDLFGGSEPPYESIIGRVPKGWNNPEASWRKIRVCNAKVPAPLNMRFSYSSYDADDAIPPFDITFALEKDDTLEHLFDIFDGFIATLSQYYHKKTSTDVDHDEERRLMEQKQAKERDELARDFGEALKYRRREVEDANDRT